MLWEGRWPAFIYCNENRKSEPLFHDISVHRLYPSDSEMSCCVCMRMGVCRPGSVERPTPSQPQPRRDMGHLVGQLF